MRLLRLAVIAAALLAGAVGSTAAPVVGRISIEVQNSNWGDARPRDIEAVLNSVASVLAPHFPRHASTRVVVAHSPAGPRVLARKSGGAHVVLLNVQDRRWDQFAYQFSHELCHIFSNYDQRPISVDPASREHQWLEETLCEAVSLVTLNRLASSWENSPPHAGWESYAPAFREYAERLLSASHRRPPPEESITGWQRRHQTALELNPYLREKNELLAASLLDLFDNTPGSLEAIGYLNLEAPAHADLAVYLAAWHDCCPPTQRPFVLRLIALLAAV